MKIRIKKDVDTTRKLVDKTSVPITVVDQILGKIFTVRAFNKLHYEVPALFDGKKSVWAIPTDCVEVVER